jgi:hypothetical protein
MKLWKWQKPIGRLHFSFSHNFGLTCSDFNILCLTLFCSTLLGHIFFALDNLEYNLLILWGLTFLGSTILGLDPSGFCYRILTSLINLNRFELFGSINSKVPSVVLSFCVLFWSLTFLGMTFSDLIFSHLTILVTTFVFWVKLKAIALQNNFLITFI